MGDDMATIVTASPTRQRAFLVVILFTTLLFSFLAAATVIPFLLV
jgi:hypothetical protein